jgi:hypothetical protein
MKNTEWKVNWNYLCADKKSIEDIKYLIAKMIADQIWEEAKQIVKVKGA